MADGHRPRQKSRRNAPGISPDQAIAMGLHMVTKHRLTGWSLHVGDLNPRAWLTGYAPWLAMCYCCCKRIVLDQRSLWRSRYRVRQILLHEVAHAMVGEEDGDGHCVLWQRNAQALGVRAREIRYFAELHVRCMAGMAEPRKPAHNCRYFY